MQYDDPDHEDQGNPAVAFALGSMVITGVLAGVLTGYFFPGHGPAGFLLGAAAGLAIWWRVYR